MMHRIFYDGRVFMSIADMAISYKIDQKEVCDALEYGLFRDKPISQENPEIKRFFEKPLITVRDRGTPLMHHVVTCLISSNYRG